MSFISPTRWNTILTKLNQKRTDGGYSPVSTDFSGYIKQSNIDTLRNGLNEILIKYQYTNLPDALNHVGYAYNTWKSWDYNFIATRSLDEIENILDTMWYTPQGTKEYIKDVVLSGRLLGSFNGGYFRDEKVLQLPGWVTAISSSWNVSGIQLLFVTRFTWQMETTENYDIKATMRFGYISPGEYIVSITGYVEVNFSRCIFYHPHDFSIRASNIAYGSNPVGLSHYARLRTYQLPYYFHSTSPWVTQTIHFDKDFHYATEDEWGHN